MGASDAYWRIFAQTGGIGAYLMYRTCSETPPDRPDLLAAELSLARWEIAEELGPDAQLMFDQTLATREDDDGAAPDRGDRASHPQPRRSRQDPRDHHPR